MKKIITGILAASMLLPVAATAKPDSEKLKKGFYTCLLYTSDAADE